MSCFRFLCIALLPFLSLTSCKSPSSHGQPAEGSRAAAPAHLHPSGRELPFYAACEANGVAERKEDGCPTALRSADEISLMQAVSGPACPVTFDPGAPDGFSARLEVIKRTAIEVPNQATGGLVLSEWLVRVLDAGAACEARLVFSVEGSVPLLRQGQRISLHSRSAQYKEDDAVAVRELRNETGTLLLGTYNGQFRRHPAEGIKGLELDGAETSLCEAASLYSVKVRSASLDGSCLLESGALGCCGDAKSSLAVRLVIAGGAPVRYLIYSVAQVGFLARPEAPARQATSLAH